MPRRFQAWYGLAELAALGDRGAELHGQFELAELTRLTPLVHVDRDATVDVTVRMGRTERGDLVMSVEMRSEVSLICQRCLEPLNHLIDESIKWRVLESDAAEVTSRSDCEVLELKANRLRLAELVEDELIVSLPLVARHESVDECGALAQNLMSAPRVRGAESAGPPLKV